MNLNSRPENLKSKVITILLLAIPAIIENFFQTVIGFVDTFFISQLGLIEVSAVAITNVVLQVYFAIFMSLGIAANILIAKAVGAQQGEKAKLIAQQTIVSGLIVGIIFGLLTLFFAKPILSLMGADESVLELASIYFKITAIPSIFISLMFILGSILRGTGDTKTPMKISIWINILHIFLDYIFIFGLFFIPAMGIAGAAIATVLVRIIGTILLFHYIRKNTSLLTVNFKSYIPIKSIQLNIFSLSGPAAGERLVMRIGQVLYFGFVIQLGTNTFAAHSIAGNIEIFSYMIGYGLATAATTLVGQQLGAGNYLKAKHYAFITTIISVGIMSVVGILLFFFGGTIGSLFTDNIIVKEEIKIALQVDAFIQPLLAVVLVLTGVFQGGGNTKFPMYMTTIGIWLIRTIGVYLLAIYFNLGILGVWIAIGLDNLFRAIMLSISFYKDKWVTPKEMEESIKT